MNPLPAQSFVVLNPPHTVYSSSRNAEGRLDSVRCHAPAKTVHIPQGSQVCSSPKPAAVTPPRRPSSARCAPFLAHVNAVPSVRCLQTVRVVVRIQLAGSVVSQVHARMNDELRMRIQQPGSQGLLKIVEEVLSSLIHADLLYFDGQVPYTFHEDASEGAQALLTRNIDAPSVRYMPDPEARGVVLACVAPRSLPISSAHCGRE